jgi:hypothetical protein
MEQLFCSLLFQIGGVDVRNGHATRQKLYPVSRLLLFQCKNKKDENRIRVNLSGEVYFSRIKVVSRKTSPFIDSP